MNYPRGFCQALAQANWSAQHPPGGTAFYSPPPVVTVLVYSVLSGGRSFERSRPGESAGNVRSGLCDGRLMLVMATFLHTVRRALLTLGEQIPAACTTWGSPASGPNGAPVIRGTVHAVPVPRIVAANAA